MHYFAEAETAVPVDFKIIIILIDLGRAVLLGLISVLISNNEINHGDQSSLK